MKIALLAMLLFPMLSIAQLRDNFSDGDFTQSPTWKGDENSFLVNEQGQLQSNGPAVTGTTLRLVTPSQAVVGTVWEFWINLKLATSSGNYTDIYLIADSEDLQDSGTSGYFVRIGGTADEVSLFRKDAGKAAVILINGEDKTIGGSDNVVRVRVERNTAYEWKLDTDFSGTGQSYIGQGSATDSTYKRSAWSGVLLRYSSANSKSFYFDDFSITDSQPPILEEVQKVNSQELTLRFNEPLEPASAAEAGNYTLSSHVKPILAELIEDGAVRLVFSQSFSAGENTLYITGLSDLYGNRMKTPAGIQFSFVPAAVLPGYNELLITEIMADEAPAVGLPPQEYIELYNPTDKPLSLQGVRYSDATSTAIFPDVQLLPGEYAVVVPNAQVENFMAYGKVIGISNFPSLNNTGEVLQLRQPNGQHIYALHYSDAWYKDNSKREGGWSLEMIDVTNPCSAENWTASVDPRGGTPAQPNSAAASNPDNTPPMLTDVIAVAADKLLLQFNERLDSVQAGNTVRYILSPYINIAYVEVQGPLFTKVTLHLAEPLQERQLYTLTAKGLTDCAGNLSSEQQVTFALPSAPEPGDVVINEVLFNPRPNGADFVELVNRSGKYINLLHWQLANTSSDSVSNHRTITTGHYVLAPGAYVVLTSDPNNIKSNYPAAKEETLLHMASLPSYPDEAGTVVLLQPDGRTADRFSYDAGMHFRLIDDKSGVSLERIRLEGPTEASNFHSAASTAGYATPGYKNSQSQHGIVAQQLFHIDPAVFSPDGDGYEDFTTLNFTTDQTGFVANVTVFDAQGREIRKLARNELLASNGFFRWDGLREDGAKAAIGYYLFYIELFDLNGQKREYKEKVVLGGRFD